MWPRKTAHSKLHSGGWVFFVQNNTNFRPGAVALHGNNLNERII